MGASLLQGIELYTPGLAVVMVEDHRNSEYSVND